MNLVGKRFEASGTRAACLRLAFRLTVVLLVAFTFQASLRSGPQAGAPIVRIDTPASGWTALKVVQVRGRVLNAPGITEARFILNGEERFIPVRSGAFAQEIVLGAGANYLKVEVVDAAGRAGSTGVKLVTNNAQMDLKVILTWDTDRTDVDLWVTDPNSERVFYGHRTSKLGGTLDTDVTTGYGPETFTLPEAVPGEYLVQAQYYGGASPTMARVVVVLYEGTPNEKRYIFPALLQKGGDGTTIGRFRVD